MLKTYDHAITRAELKEVMASSVRQMLEDAPNDATSLEALLRHGGQLGQSVTGEDGPDEATILSEEARQTLAWIEALDE